MTAPVDPGRPRRRVVHRLPKSVRQHWKLLIAAVAVMIAVAVGFGDVRIRPYVTGDLTAATPAITDNIAGTVELFDSSVPHTLSVEISDAGYRDMVAQFTADGDKKWVNARVTIDGTVLDDVAVRLKGNSTLMSLRGKKFGPEGWSGPPPSMGPIGKVSADEPTSLPLLLSFDEYAAGRAYQGMTELAVRPGTPVLNEAMALTMTALTGQPTQRHAYVTYSINGATTTRLVLEHPDEGYAGRVFDGDGYLYKARAGSRLEYRGPSQADYASEFKQINAVESGNLQPLIDFVHWLGAADDAEFDAGLAEWVDVESFARYVATQNLLVNADDMAGPGQNYYLWYDLETRKFSVLSWDLNLAMVTGDATLGPRDPLKLKPPPGVKPPPWAESGGGPPPFRDGNILKERFLASAAFADLYDAVYWELYDQLYADGRAVELLDTVVATVPVTAGHSHRDLQIAAESLRRWLTERTEALAQLSSARPG